MDSSVKMSPRWGLNETKVVCFWCNREIRTEYLGQIDEKDSKAPRSICKDYAPCPVCSELWNAKGIVLIGITTEEFDDGRPPMAQRVNEKGEFEFAYPTGAYMLPNQDVLLEMYDANYVLELVAKSRFNPVQILVDDTFLKKLSEKHKCEDAEKAEKVVEKMLNEENDDNENEK